MPLLHNVKAALGDEFYLVAISHNYPNCILSSVIVFIYLGAQTSLFLQKKEV